MAGFFLRQSKIQNLMMKSFRRILIVGFLIYNFGFNAQSLAQDRPLKKINWGVTSLSAAMWIPVAGQGGEDLTKKMV